MGQRLNIEVWDNGKVLANAYYHWSAYTSSAAELTKMVLNFIRDNEPYEKKLLYAIRALESTGAKLVGDDITKAEKVPELSDCFFDRATNRNDGLLGFTDQSIQSTRYWEEGRVSIFLDEQRVDFNVFWKTDCWSWEKEQREDYDNPEADHKQLACLPVNFSCIKFDCFDEVAEKYLLHTEGDPFTVTAYPNEVVTPIY